MIQLFELCLWTVVVPDILILAWLSCYLGCEYFPPWEVWLIMMGILSQKPETKGIAHAQDLEQTQHWC